MLDEKQFLTNLRHIIFRSYQTGLLEKIDRYKLTFLQRNILLTLKNHGNLNMTQLCRLLVLQKPAMTRLVDNLEKRGYVTRTRMEDDRRGFCITLTENAKKIINSLEDVPLDVLKKTFSKSTQSEQKQLSEGFSMFLEKLNKVETDYFEV